MLCFQKPGYKTLEVVRDRCRPLQATEGVALDSKGQLPLFWSVRHARRHCWRHLGEATPPLGQGITTFALFLVIIYVMSPPPPQMGDKTLAQSAQMYHYQHRKQQMLSVGQ